MVERQPTGAKGNDGNRQGGPRQMEISPPVRYDELDHSGHNEEAERSETRGKAQHKQIGSVISARPVR